MRVRIIRLSIACLLCSQALLLCVSAGCNQAAPAAPVEQTGSATNSGAQRVVAGKPERKTIRLSTTQPGQIQAFEETPLFAKLSGYVEKVLVDIGDKVTEGQTLVTIDIPEMHDELEHKRALVAQAEAELEQAEVAVAGAKAAIKTAEARVAQANAGVIAAKGMHERWDAEHDRVKQLAENQSLNQRVVDETRNQLKGVEGAYQEALANVGSSQALLAESHVYVRKTEADLDAAAVRLRVAKAEAARATTLLDYTTIKAPYAGVVTRRLVVTGDYVAPANATSAKPILVVCRTDVVRIFVDVPELEAAWVDDGDQATVSVQALPGKPFEAQVTRNSWSLDPTNRSLRTEIDVANPQAILRPGMFATATILLEQRPDVLSLPTAALVREGQDALCCTVQGGKIKRQKLELGLRSGADVEILGGLAEGQTVVLARAELLKPGQAVEVIVPEKK